MCTSLVRGSRTILSSVAVISDFCSESYEERTLLRAALSNGPHNKRLSAENRPQPRRSQAASEISPLSTFLEAAAGVAIATIQQVLRIV